jgi:hypothetical protein
MATNLQHKLQFSSTSSSGVTSPSGYDIEASNTNAEIYSQVSFPANSANAAFSMSFNAAKLQDIFIVASQNCTINTNGTNSTELTLVAGIPFVWGVSMPNSNGWPTNPFAGTVNAGSLTCNAATQLKFLIGSA